jgi:hypothetical protein
MIDKLSDKTRTCRAVQQKVRNRVSYNISSTEHRSRVANTIASCSRSPGFKSPPRDWLSD